MLLDFIVSLSLYDRKACTYIAAAILISLRSKLMDDENMSQDWQALQFFSNLNSRQIPIDFLKVCTWTVTFRDYSRLCLSIVPPQRVRRQLLVITTHMSMLTQVRSLAYQICQGTPQSLAPRCDPTLAQNEVPFQIS